MKHVMLDLETLDTKPGAAIVAIGAVSFTQVNGIESSFYRVISLESALAHGTISAGTLGFWLQQEDAARAELTRTDATDAVSALQDFAEWMRHKVRAGDSNYALRVWGNGVGLDNALLRHALEQQNMRVPWDFWEDRCYRTLKATYKSVSVGRVGTLHNALDDAKTQALHLLRIAERYKLPLEE